MARGTRYYGYLVVRGFLLSVDPLEKDRLLVVFTLHLHHDAVLSGLLLGAAGDTPGRFSTNPSTHQHI